MPMRYALQTERASREHTDGLRITAALLVMAAVFSACIFGILTRPSGFLANVWPANAIMLGVLLRVPAAASPLGWISGGFAFVLADLLTGSPLIKALLLTGANLAGIGTAYALFARSPPETIRLKQPISVIYLILISAAAGIAAGIVGGIANPLIFGSSVLAGVSFWFATEFVNYIALLPVILTAPHYTSFRNFLRPEQWKSANFIPAAALAVSCLAATIIGGPGALAFPVPALLWCGLTYSVFPTAVSTLLFGLWTLVVISARYLPEFPPEFDAMTLASMRMGTSLIALVPIVLASVMQSRNDLLTKLHHIASHDQLTGASSRSAFLEEAKRITAVSQTPLAVLMIDIDHFKAVNDTYGHASGDEVLKSFAQRVRGCLRPQDLFGRLGGEEFAVIVSDCPACEALRIGDRIRNVARSEPVSLPDGRSVAITTSLGIATRSASANSPISDLLAKADHALYAAKKNGRNRLEHATDVLNSSLPPDDGRPRA